MKNKKVTDCCKNAVGTMFLLMGTFFVCSTLVSMRAVLADPIAPDDSVMATDAQLTRANTANRNARTSPRGNNATTNANIARTTSPRGAGVTSRSVANRNVVSRANNQTASIATGRNVVSRNTASNTSRSVRSRVAGVSGAARVSLQGSAIRGSKASTTNNYTYLSSKLYTGNYSNIVDSTTGMISADAYQNCLESYYTCMDEICTARNASQGRCSCAARTKAFASAEKALEVANEELIKVSGELALLVATKGKDVSSAFQLTDAEKVMNCVSWQEMQAKYAGGYKYIENGQYTKTESNSTVDAAEYWCNAHSIYNNESCSATTSPAYCSDTGNNFGFDLKNIEGSSSDILASLQAWADAKESTVSILKDDNTNLLAQYAGVMYVVSGMGLTTDVNSTNSELDNLANTWGYELFQYAHNNVCSRVLDSCFNGIYEACGTPPYKGKCANSATSSCPYNYNSNIKVSATGNVTLNERGSSTASNSNSSATCFGYTSASGDPYVTLRGPVADARRSIMQKYLLDSNAACDVYGEQLRNAAQNIGYQKVAAQQALQQKRLEFVNEEKVSIETGYRAARANFNECLAELYDCYTTQENSNQNWSTSRIKTYCAQVSNVPHCYETMICDAPNNKLAAVITRDAGNTACVNSEEYETNTCRNVITLSEILSNSYASGAADDSSAKKREACLQNIGIDGVRNWTINQNNTNVWPDNN